MTDTTKRAEVLLAKALIACEPEKVHGGSKTRQDWLRLVMDVQLYLHENAMNTELFRKELIDD